MVQKWFPTRSKLEPRKTRNTRNPMRENIKIENRQKHGGKKMEKRIVFLPISFCPQHKNEKHNRSKPGKCSVRNTLSVSKTILPFTAPVPVDADTSGISDVENGDSDAQAAS